MQIRESARVWQCAEKRFSLERPLIMGILNVTPDSFSDGGEHNRLEDAVDWARRMRAEGADIIDVGGESTRPGFGVVTLEEERGRVLPVVERLLAEGFVVSVDTSKPEIMTEAAALGAQILNDVRGFDLPGALEAAAATDCGLVIMHSVPSENRDKVQVVEDYLREHSESFLARGVGRERICWDPGFGFAKNPEENMALIAATERYAASGFPVMAAVSRKSTLGVITGRTVPRERAVASASLALLAAERGATVLRVHDVAMTRDALLVLEAFRAAQRAQA